MLGYEHVGPLADSTAITKLADGREGEGMVGEVWGPT